MNPHRNKSPKRPKKNQLIAGAANIAAAMQDGVSLDKIYLDQKLISAEAGALKNEAAKAGVPLSYVPAARLAVFNIENHGGCIALRSKVQYQNLQDVISLTVENGEVPLFLILDGITDVRNIGGIARTAWCCGVQAIIIPEKGVGALNEDAVLTSAGALEQIAVCRVSSLMKAVDELHLNGIKVYATNMQGSKPLSGVGFSEPCAIVMGSEDKGVQTSLLKICDETLHIPMRNNFESLNVAVATGIILYQAMQQRI